jgi:competence protein ComEA
MVGGAQNGASHSLVMGLPLQLSRAKSENGQVFTRRRIIMAGAAILASLPALSKAAQNAKTPLPPESRVDINHATTAELLAVPGMTPSWAGRIVRFRPYHSKDELLTRGVVTGSEYSRIKEYIIAHRNPQ